MVVEFGYFPFKLVSTLFIHQLDLLMAAANFEDDHAPYVAPDSFYLLSQSFLFGHVGVDGFRDP